MKKTQVVISTSKDLSDSDRRELFGEFKKAYKLEDKDLLSVDKVDGSIGSDLRNMAILACVIAVVCMLVYITFRFEFLQGLCAIFALIFDLTMVLGVFAIFNIQVNSSFIAAMLTILGYSINDTIITFDRVRENTSKVRKGNYYDLVNVSINQTMARSINTTITTLIVVTPLLLLGTTSIKEFVFPMIVGFISGVFSSVCLAVPLWYLLKEKQKEKEPENTYVQDNRKRKHEGEGYYLDEEVVEKTEEEILKEKEEKKARRKARKQKKQSKKKGIR